MIKNLAKVDTLSRDLAEKLKLRIAGAAAGRVDTAAESRDADGNPMITLSDNGTVTAGNPVILIRMKQEDAVSKDVFGNDLKAYTPHVCEIAYELDGTEAEPNRKDLILVMFELAKIGIKVEVKEIADGTAVSAAAADAAAVAQELDWLHWPTKGI